MKIGDLIQWKRKPNDADEWVGVVVRLEDPSFVHVLWSNQDKVWTWVHRNNVEVLNESR